MGDFMRFNSSQFRGIKSDYEKFDKAREALIGDTREVIKSSKKLIASVHKNDLKGTKALLADMEKGFRKLQACRNEELKHSGLMRSALQEYVEAKAFYQVIFEDKVPTKAELKVDTESYLMGLCDLAGELQRAGVHAAIRKDDERLDTFRKLVSDIHNELLEFVFRNGELRRKFDTVKYAVKRLDDVAFELSIRPSKSGGKR